MQETNSNSRFTFLCGLSADRQAFREEKKSPQSFLLHLLDSILFEPLLLRIHQRYACSTLGYINHNEQTKKVNP